MVELDLNAYNESLKRVTASDLASQKSVTRLIPGAKCRD